MSGTNCVSLSSDAIPVLIQVKEITKMQLGLWGIDYFDLFHMHFPVSLEYVDPAHRYPPEWWGDDKKVHPSKSLYTMMFYCLYMLCIGKVPIQETWTAMEELVDDGLAKNIGIRYAEFVAHMSGSGF